MKNPRIEKALIVFLITTLILGVVVRAYRDRHSRVTISIGRFDPEEFKE